MDRKPSIRITTPKAIAIYPRLKTPDTKFDAAGVYKVTLRLDPSAKGFDELVAAAEKVREDMVEWTRNDLQKAIDNAKNGAARKKAQTALDELSVLDLPIRDHEDSEGEPTGDKVITAKMKATYKDKNDVERKRTPVIMDGRNNAIPHDAINIGGGSEVKAKITLAGYYTPKDNEVGVAVRLEGVKVYKLVEFGAADMADWDDDDDEEGEDLTSRIRKDEPKAERDSDGGSDAEDADF